MGGIWGSQSDQVTQSDQGTPSDLVDEKNNDNVSNVSDIDNTLGVPGEQKAKKLWSDRFKSLTDSAKSLATNIWDKSPEQIKKMMEKGNTEMGFPNERIFLALCMLLKVNPDIGDALSEFKNILFEYSKNNTIQTNNGLKIDEFVETAIINANQEEYYKLVDVPAKKKFIETKKQNFIKDIKKHDPNKTSGGSKKPKKTRKSKKPKTDKKKRTHKKK